MSGTYSRTVVASALALLVAAPFAVVDEWALYGRGWDFTVYCRAAVVASTGGNPYYVETLGTNLPYVYPPLTTPVFQLLCAPGAFVETNTLYLVVYTLVLLGAWVHLARVFGHPWFVGAVLTTGLTGVASTLQTGNLGVVLLTGLSVCLVSLHRGSGWTTTVTTLTALASFKLYPALFGLGFGTGDGRLRDRILVGSAAGLGCVGFLGLNFVVAPQHTRSYVAAVTGEIEQHAPLAESGGVTNPALYQFFETLAGSGSGVTAYLLVVATVVVTTGVVLRRPQVDDVDRLAVTTVLVVTVLPRLKPYDLAVVLPGAAVLAITRGGWRARLATLGWLCVVPQLVRQAQQGDVSVPPVPGARLVVEYGLLLCLCGYLAAVVWWLHRQTATPRAAAQE